jgi:hypothetical protein
MHILFSLLRIKGLYMFQELIAHLQEAPHFVYCVGFVSVGCTSVKVAPVLKFHFNPGQANWHNMYAIYQVPFVLHLLRMST